MIYIVLYTGFASREQRKFKIIVKGVEAELSVSNNLNR